MLVYVWSCACACTDTHTHTNTGQQILRDEWSHKGSQQIGSQALGERALKEKTFDKESVLLSALDKTRTRTISGTLTSASERGGKLFAVEPLGGVGLHLMLSPHRLMVSVSIQEILGDDTPGREAWSRLIAVSQITRRCLYHEAAQNHRVGRSVGLLLFIAMLAPSLPMHVTSQTGSVLCRDQRDRPTT